MSQLVPLLELNLGGVTLARAVTDEELSNEIATAIRNVVITLQEGE